MGEQKNKNLTETIDEIFAGAFDSSQNEWHYRKKYKIIEYVNAYQLTQKILAPIEENLYTTYYNAIYYILNQSNKITGIFNEEFKYLDDILKSKSQQLECFTTDKKKIEELIRESESKLAWLETIKAKIESLIEI